MTKPPQLGRSANGSSAVWIAAVTQSNQRCGSWQLQVPIRRTSEVRFLHHEKHMLGIDREQADLHLFDPIRRVIVRPLQAVRSVVHPAAIALMPQMPHDNAENRTEETGCIGVKRSLTAASQTRSQCSRLPRPD